MHIEVIVRINGAVARAESYSQPTVMETSHGEAVAPDRQEKFELGDALYGFPTQVDHPYDRAELVLEYLCARARVRTAEKLEELKGDAFAELAQKQRAFIIQHAGAISERLRNSDEPLPGAVVDVEAILREADAASF